MTFRKLARTILHLDFLKAMSLTFMSLFSKPITRQYPSEKRPVSSGFRGLHALTRDSVTGEARCVGCGLCAAICPSQCIHIYTSEGPESKKIVERYEIDVLRCVYCCLCVEACPYTAIALTEHYEYADFSRQALYMTKDRLLDNYDLYMGREKDEHYFRLFWHPRRTDFMTPLDQAVFRRRP
jgi:NADH-quinone oxidoreductase subunit I